MNHELNHKLLFVLLVTTAACAPERDDALAPDASPATADAQHSSDAPVAPACSTDGKIYVGEGLDGAVRVSRYDDVLTGGVEVADVECPAAATALGVLRDGSMFAALTGGQLARITAAACTPFAVTPAWSGDLALVGVDDELLVLERTGGKLWRVDPATGAATNVATVSGTGELTSLVGGELGVHVYMPAGLVGTGKLIPLDALFQPGAAATITGASSTQAQADWVGVVGDNAKLWMTASGYYGAGGGRRTMWMPVENNSVSYAAIEYYSPTFAVTATTCP